MRVATLLVLLTSVTFFSLGQPATVTTEPFNSFHVFGPFQVLLIKSPTEKIEIDYRGTDKEKVLIKSSGNKLLIKFRNKEYFDNWNSDLYNGQQIRVKVYYKELKEIEARAGSQITSDDPIESKYIFLTCSMGSEMKLNVRADEIELNASMGSEVKLAGTSRKLDLTAKMGADVTSERLICEDVSVSASMGADVFVYASRDLDISAGFGASVNYMGAAAVNHSSKYFGADIQSRRR
jgi:hypothetical protein